MTTTQSALSSRTWFAPETLRVRGTIVVLGGRGETPDVYHRFGTRLSADSYSVVAFSGAFGNEAELIAELHSRIAGDQFATPVVLIGSDVGAVAAVDVTAALGSEVAAVILAGYPAADASFVTDDWESELVERTTCPVHRGVLDSDGSVLHGSFGDALHAARIARDLGTLSVPVVAIHGGADLISPIDGAVATYQSGRDAEIWVIEGAKHDVLNDATHRTTASVIVQFLETLRSGSQTAIARRLK